MSWALLLTFALTGLIFGDNCVEDSVCLDSLYLAVINLQSGDFSGYCRNSESYVACSETSLVGCNRKTSNLVKHTRNTQAVYCASGSNPGYLECQTRRSVCEAIYDQFQSLSLCSDLDRYVVCVLRDLSSCHQSTFNTTSMTQALKESATLSCGAGNASCAVQYIMCQTTSLLVTQSLEVNNLDGFCSHVDTFLACRRSLHDGCDNIYTTPTALLLSEEMVTKDKALYCRPNGSSPSYFSCLQKQKSCESRLYITGDIDNTVVLYYCRSLVEYRTCLSRDLAPCQQDAINLPALLASTTTNFTRTCSGINIYAGVREMCCSPIMLLLTLAVVLVYVAS
ncbi:uncharacterized protein LOC124287668 [Haliotis rubra]|uniref:uncharacterized protein LOC124287668 n=1 Tax=Haliotis rubra TaxID=36100 RepID=UPI001EE61C3C|nr:uncharacterized protein LOC124287668 [Haliotis rubra]